MSRSVHISLPPAMQQTLDWICEEFSVNRSKLIKKGIQWAIDDFMGKQGRPVQAPTTTPKASPSPTPAAVPAQAAGEAVALSKPPGYPNPHGIAPITRGDGAWFQLGLVAKSLGISTEDILEDVPVDELLDYRDERWINLEGVQIACGLCIDNKLADLVYAWCQHMEQVAR